MLADTGKNDTISTLLNGFLLKNADLCYIYCSLRLVKEIKYFNGDALYMCKK